MNRQTVVQVYRDTQEPVKDLFTGTHYECVQAIKFLIDRKGWNLCDLSIIDKETERHVSFAIPHEVR